MLKCIESTEEALAALSDGRGAMPLRNIMTLPLGEGKTGFLGMMPSYLPGKCSIVLPGYNVLSRRV